MFDEHLDDDQDGFDGPIGTGLYRDTDSRDAWEWATDDGTELSLDF